ncbi:MAG: dienelactone hydrolase family protein [Nocardioides sp.]|nr:dienelactone hydrolase family protein [Nocardioides sp.]
MGETIEIRAPDRAAEAYLSAAAGKPGVLLYVDAIGLRRQIQEMCDRIASWGYVVLAPHVLYRDGSAAALAPHGDLREAGARETFFGSGVMDRVSALTPDRAGPDAQAWMATLLRHAGDGPVGTVGYCMGARLAVRTGGQFPGSVAAVGGFHGGGLVTEESQSPHLAIAASTAADAFGHADQDGSMPLEAVQTLEEALTGAGWEHVNNEIYEGAPHGYSMADTSM